MSPEASSDSARRRMQRQRRRDTKAEVAVRKELHRLGLRYRVERRILPAVRRTADIVFARSKVVVFVDGCFWHSCPMHATRPAANADWWTEKLAANVTRDRDTDRRLTEAGWLVVRLWEHEEPAAAAQMVARVVAARRTRPMGGRA